MQALRNTWRRGGKYKPRVKGAKQERNAKREEEEEKKARSEEEERKGTESKEEETKSDENKATGIENLQADTAFSAPIGINVGPSFARDYPDVGDPTLTGDYSFVRIIKRHDGLESSVKIVKREHIDGKGVMRLRNEARLLHEMDSPHIIKLHGYYEEQDAIYMAVENCDGGELFEYTAEKQEKYTEEQARDVVQQLLQAIAYLHQQGVVLSNLLPQRLQLSGDMPNPVLKITSLESAIKGSVPMDPEDQGVSPEYSAPEVFMLKPCTMSADIWRVGVITYILVGGYLPFSGKTQAELLKKIRLGQLTFVENWDVTTPDVQDLIRRMLEVNPGRRITAADALKHKWMTLTGPELEMRSLLPALNEFRRMNAKRKFKHIVFCAAHLVYGLRVAMEDEETARAYQVAEHFVYQLDSVKQAEHSESSQGLPRGGLPSSPSAKALFGPYLRHTLVRVLEREPEPTTYIDKDRGVRLVVPSGVARLPKPVGPVLLQDTAQVIEFEGTSFFASTMVMCVAPGVQFSPPLLLDFLLDPEESLAQAKSKFNAGYYQVFHKNHEDSIWNRIPLPELTLDVLREGVGKSNNFIQTKVEHFSCFALCKRDPIEGGIIHENQQDKKTVIVRNSCEVQVMVVCQPTSATGSIRRRFAIGIQAFGGGGNAQNDRAARNTFFRAAETSNYRSVLPESTCSFDGLGRKTTARLLFATRENLENRGEGKMCTLKLWGSVSARGGRSVRLMPSLLEGDAQNEGVLPVLGTNFKRAILDLDGAPENEHRQPAPVLEDDHDGLGEL